jgi:hypothetical protein
VTAAANPTLSQRSGTVTVAGQTFTVTQAANTCTYSISPAGQNVPAAGGTASTTVTASDAACSWTAVSSDTWLTVTTPSGTGTGQASFTVDVNLTTSQRTGTVTVAGQTFTVSQAANTADCTYSISPSSRTVPEGGGPVSTTVTASDASCVWTVVNNANWVTVTTPSGTGSGTASFMTAPNLTTSTRLATLSVAGRTFRIAQAAGTTACTYSISPTSHNVMVGGGTVSTTVTTSTSACAWNAITSSLWMTVAPTSGTGTSTISITVAANPSTSQRSGTVNIGGQILSVTQAGGCSYTISPTTRSVSAAAGSSNTYVTTTSACAWTASTTASWITLTNTGGTGSGALAYSFAANTGSVARTATITVANQVHTVTQAGATTSTAPNAPAAPKNFRISGGGE